MYVNLSLQVGPRNFCTLVQNPGTRLAKRNGISDSHRPKLRHPQVKWLPNIYQSVSGFDHLFVGLIKLKTSEVISWQCLLLAVILWLFIVLPHWNAKSQTHDITPLPVTVYRHKVNLTLYYPLLSNITLEAITTHLIVFGLSRYSTHEANIYITMLTWRHTLKTW